MLLVSGEEFHLLLESKRDVLVSPLQLGVM